MSESASYENDFTFGWVRNLLSGMEEPIFFEKCAEYHYNCNQMDEVIQKYIGDLAGFLAFLEKEWGWKTRITEDGTKIIIDENKDFCVCPVVNALKENIPYSICYCSECFAKKMISKVIGREVEAKVIRSVIRDGKSCMYEIML